LAIYHLSIKIVTRGKGKTAVAAAAYRAGETIKSEFDGNVHDYSRKGGVVHTEIFLPENAPSEYADRDVLWNAVEKSERYVNAQLAREIEIALPVELSREQNISLLRRYAIENFANEGMCADVCYHDKGDGNPHAHIMLTMRPIEKGGNWGQKSRTVNGQKVPTVDWNEHTKAEDWRKAWAAYCNSALRINGVETLVDHRSYKRQGIDQIPTVHLGAAACQMERKGIKTERGNINRAVEVTNNQLRQLTARILKCKEWLYSQPIENAPTMVSVMNRAADVKNLKTRYQKTANLKTQAKILMFLQNNNINDMAQLADRVTKISEELLDVSTKIKAVDRRLDTLALHIFHYDNYRLHKAVYDEYQNAKPKKRDGFFEKHSEQIQLFEDAKHYLDGVMNGRTKIPIKSWREEQTKLTAERFSLCEVYYRLKDDTRNVELLRKGAEEIIKENEREQQRARAQGKEL
jgi:hypothetical protein